MSSPESKTKQREQDRLKALHTLQILETPIEQRFEQITELLQTIFDVPVSALSFVDRHRQWFKSIQGLRVEQTMRSVAFCQHTVCADRPTIVPDARFDEHFGNNELVTSDPGIVFYAGVPVRTPEGMPVASLCIIDFEPRMLDDREIAILEQMARLTEILLQTPRTCEAEEALLQHVGESWRSTMIDPLTRIWNAEGIKTLIHESVNHAKTHAQRVGVAMFELTGLDGYRQRYGHPAGDELLVKFTRRALKSMKPHDSIGRLREGEFGLALNKVANKDDLYDRTAMLQMIADDLTPSECAQEKSIGARIAGVLVHPDHAASATQAMEQVEGMLTGRHEDKTSIPMIIESVESDDIFERFQEAA